MSFTVMNVMRIGCSALAEMVAKASDDAQRRGSTMTVADIEKNNMYTTQTLTMCGTHSYRCGRHIHKCTGIIAINTP